MADPLSPYEQYKRRHKIGIRPLRKEAPEKGMFVPNIPLDATQVEDRRFDGFVQDVFHWFTSDVPGNLKHELYRRGYVRGRGPLSPEEIKRRLDSISPPKEKLMARKNPAKPARTNSRPARSNAGGATRGAARAALVKTMNATKATTRSAGSTLGGGTPAKPTAAMKGLAKAASRKSRIR